MKRVSIIILAATAMITSCYRSDLTNTTHPNEGKVEVEVTLPTADPSIDSEDATIPDSYTIILNGTEVEVGEDGTVELPDLLDPGVYTLYVYSNTSDLEMENNITELGDGTIVSSTVVDASMITSLSEDLYFGTQIITVTADTVIASEVTLSQVTRTVKFDLQITEGDPDRISSITATLSGIAQQWECVEDVPIGESATIAPLFAQGESLTKSEESNDYLSSSIKVLGVNGDEQYLTITLTYTDGKTQTITSYLGDEFSGSNDTKSTPLILTGDLHTPIEGVTEGATIDNWQQINGGTATVN